jgi:hypothetical protein
VTGAVKAVTEFERNLGKGKDVGDPTFNINKKNKFSCVGEVFPLDRGLLMGDPFVLRKRDYLHSPRHVATGAAGFLYPGLTFSPNLIVSGLQKGPCQSSIHPKPSAWPMAFLQAEVPFL